MFDYDNYCLKDEIWKDIPFYEGLYQASNLGRIRSVDGKKTFSKLHGIRIWKGRILKNKTIIPNDSGYKVDLWKDGKSKGWLVARLVCITFKGFPENYNEKNIKLKPTVNHIDGNRLNNRIDNLEWLSLKDNINHGFKNNLYPQKNIILINKQTLKSHEFNSLSKASEFLGKNNRYLSGQIKRKQKIKNKEGVEFIATIPFGGKNNVLP